MGFSFQKSPSGSCVGLTQKDKIGGWEAAAEAQEKGELGLG